MPLNIEQADRSNPFKRPTLRQNGRKFRKAIIVSFKLLFDDGCDNFTSICWTEPTTSILPNTKVLGTTALFCLLMDEVKSQMTTGISVKDDLSITGN